MGPGADVLEPLGVAAAAGSSDSAREIIGGIPEAQQVFETSVMAATALLRRRLST